MVTVDDKYLKHTATLCKEVKEESFAITDIFENSTQKIDILEVGCGTGKDSLRIAKELPNSQVTGIDYDQNMINHITSNAIMQAQQNLNFKQMSVYELNDIDSYDFIRSERVFQHLQDIPNAFKRLTNALKVGGGLLIVDTNWGKLEAAPFSDAENKKIQNIFTQQLINDLTPEYLEDLYHQYEFKDIKKTIITVSLTYDDYMNASRFHEIVLDKMDEEEKSALLSKAISYKNTENFALIDMMIFYGKHS